VRDMTSRSEEGKCWGLGVWVRGSIGQEDAQDCRDLCLRRDCDYQWAILVPTHSPFSLEYLEAGLSNKRHPDPLPCLSALPLPCSDQQEPPMKPSHHPHPLSCSHVVGVAHHAGQQALKLK